MDDRQLIRYSRHILLPQIDLAGQEKLLAGRVLLIGAGGLGSPAALYLASAGVGHLTICDGDHVDLTNLQRQIVHREATVGVNKAESARRALAEINPDCQVTPVPHRVYAQELLDLVAAADVVVDACTRGALPLLVVISSFAGDEFHPMEVAINSAILTVGSWAIFSKGLGLTIPLWPTILGLAGK